MPRCACVGGGVVGRRDGCSLGAAHTPQLASRDAAVDRDGDGDGLGLRVDGTSYRVRVGGRRRRRR